MHRGPISLKYIFVFCLVGFLLSNVLWGQSRENEKVYFTTGFKIGELTDHSVIILTRLCKSEKANPIVHQQNTAPFRDPIDFDDDMPIADMDGAVQGTFGQVKIDLRSVSDTISSGWNYVSSYKDYTFKTTFESLKSNTEYQVDLYGRKNQSGPITVIHGQFKTAPNPQEIISVVFTSSTCQYFWDYDDPKRGFKVYDHMSELEPAFHCQTGDYVYYDKPGPMANTVVKARHKWNAINAWPSLVDFYANTPLFIQKDDHDVTKDDATPFSAPFGELSFEDGLAIWYEQTPTDERKPYRSLRYGKDLEVWFVEGRVFRNSDNVENPSSSIWGKEQKSWFVESVKNSDATFKILMSPTPVVGPDRKNKKDNHANSTYKTEGDWLKNFIASQKNMFVVNGDRHWQYVSRDLDTGILEFSQGPSSDAHAQGWNPEDVREEHEFLRVMGGFLAVEIGRDNNLPKIVFTHYDVDGNAVNTKMIMDE
ncbi:MAG: alkaline phosphatase D family protein [Aurantibacter sp.]